jgi:RNA methyltransferase, TrmH family
VITRNQAKRIRRLRTRKRREEGAFLAEGIRLVEELLASELIVDLVVTVPTLSETDRGGRLLEVVEQRRLVHAEVGEKEVRELADTETPQGVLAVGREPGRRLSEFKPQGDAAVLVLDRVTDPGNLGALLRTSHALGVDWVVALPGTVDPWSPKAVRASAGSMFRVPVSREPWPEAQGWLRERDFAILCADPGGEPALRAGAAVGRFALILGSEPSGLSAEVTRDCDGRVAVQLPGGMDSLNVAVAGALLLDRLLSGSSSQTDD